jgi:hypothetical protein
VGGNGGIGYLSSISGTATYYAGGGGGGTYFGGTLGTGGLGGGGNATINGTPNTGGGGGGQKNNLTTAAGTGGSGIIVLRYSTSVASVISQLLLDDVTQGGKWYAVKYMYGLTAPAQSSSHTTTNYYLDQTTLKKLSLFATDMLFREDSSNTLAVFASTSALNTVRTNILNGASWFYNTHGNSTLAGWLVGVDGKNIPDAQQSGCNSYTTTAWTIVFNSCNNPNGSHTSLDDAIRMRADFYGAPKIHSIWFRIPAVFDLPPVLAGLVGWYDGGSWTGTQWTDKSGLGNHAVTTRGTIGISTNPKGGYVLTGATTAGIQFPAAILPATYTLFHVTRYTGTQGRIFDGIVQNWLSGFHNFRAGVAYHMGWVANGADLHGTNWVVSTDQNNLYRSNGVLRGNSGAGTSGQTYDRISINYGTASTTEPSDWAVSEVLVYNRTLTTEEITSVEAYLYQNNIMAISQSVADLRSRISVASTPTGTYPLVVNGATETIYVLNTGTELWMLVGTGRENFNFTDAGNGTMSQITTNKNTNSAYWASSAFVREVMNTSTWDTNPDGILVQRFDGCNDSLRYKMTTAALAFNWSLFNPGTDVSISPYSGTVQRYAGTSWWSAGTSYTVGPFQYWTDTLAGGAANDANRTFTWTWSAHGVRGFSAGQSVTTGYMAATEGHAIQRVNVWARLT